LLTGITIPLWLLVILVAGTMYAMVGSLLFPGTRWYIRRRLNQSIERLNTNLQIKIRPFQRTKRQVLIDRLVFDSEIIEAIEETAQKEDVPNDVIQARVLGYAREIVPSFNAYMYFRIGYWIAKRVSRFLYRVRVAAEKPNLLTKVDPTATVVFVMNHRSNVDYLLVTYLAMQQTALSYAVGEWARVFPLESLLRSMGAFFVRRNSSSRLYRKVLERYVDMATQEGVCQAVYPEGGLSRDGSLGQPKLGFLDYMLRHFDDVAGRDIVFIPIGINYDHVLEDRNMMNRARDDVPRPGAMFHMKRFFMFLKENLFIGSKRRWRKNGYASVNFGIPVSCREYCQQHEIHFQRLETEARFTAVEQLANSLMQSIRHVIPVLPVPLVCSVFADAADEGLLSIDVISRVDQLINSRIQGGGAMRRDEKPRNQTLTRALEMLTSRGILLQDQDEYRVNPEARDLVKYYANSIQ
jgi:glycerol-3-phosphate O-acyltransferase